MSYTKEDYTAAVLAGKCTYKVPKGAGFETKTISYLRWVAREKSRQDMRDYLAQKLKR